MASDIVDWESAYRIRPYLEVDPHPEVLSLLSLLKTRQPCRVLDLGCGDGRHTVFFSRNNLKGVGLDYAYWGVKRTREWLLKEQIPFRLACGDMCSLPFPNCSFEAIISINVIHHNRLALIVKTFEEIYRTLVEGGIFFATLLKYRENIFAGQECEEIEPRTFVRGSGFFEEGLPHHAFLREELESLLAGYKDLHIDISSVNPHHFSVLATK
jgi:SAM-dependent methyltransferase